MPIFFHFIITRVAGPLGRICIEVKIERRDIHDPVTDGDRAFKWAGEGMRVQNVPCIHIPDLKGFSLRIVEQSIGKDDGSRDGACYANAPELLPGERIEGTNGARVAGTIHRRERSFDVEHTVRVGGRCHASSDPTFISAGAKWHLPDRTGTQIRLIEDIIDAIFIDAANVGCTGRPREKGGSAAKIGFMALLCEWNLPGLFDR